MVNTKESMEYTPQRVLVSSPHPDDCEIGCGGTLAKWIRQGAQVVLVMCTNGDKGSEDPEMTSPRLAAIRHQEQLEAAKVLGIQEVVFLDYPDGELEDSKQLRGDLVREIRRHKPDVVLTVDPHQRSFYQHRDHRITGQVTMDAIFPFSRDHLSFPEHKQLGLEPHKTPYAYFWATENPTTFVDISDTVEDKIAALAKHASQVGPPKSRDINAFIRERAGNVGKDHAMKYAEGFRVVELRR